jgi:ribonucleotide reductase alpha subunit
MRDSASRAQHYHDLALEFLVMTRFAAAVDIQERYRMMGQHYLAKAGAELARAKLDRTRVDP